MTETSLTKWTIQNFLIKTLLLHHDFSNILVWSMFGVDVGAADLSKFLMETVLKIK